MFLATFSHPSCMCYTEPFAENALGFFVATMLFAIPIVFGIVLWKVCVTDRTGFNVLGLDDRPATSAIRSEPAMPEPASSKWPLLLYLFTAALMFKLGVLAFETYQYVKKLLDAWLG